MPGECGDADKVYNVCEVCGYKQYSHDVYGTANPNEKHDWSGIKWVMGTCENPVKTEYAVCSKCLATKRTATAPVAMTDAEIEKAHKKVVARWLTNATCTTEGVVEYACSVCNISMGYGKQAQSHAWIKGEKLEDATCYAAALYQVTCSKCNTVTTKTYGATLPHNWVKTLFESKCKEVNDWYELKCTNKDCKASNADYGKVYIDHTAPAVCTYTATTNKWLLDNKDKIVGYNDTIKNEVVDCLTAGTRYVYCATCGDDPTTQDKPAAGKIELIKVTGSLGNHNMVDVHRAATCVLPERYTKACSLCGYEQPAYDAFGDETFTRVPGGDVAGNGTHNFHYSAAGVGSSAYNYLAGLNADAQKIAYATDQMRREAAGVGKSWRIGVVHPTCNSTGYIYARCENCPEQQILFSLAPDATKHVIDMATATLIAAEDCSATNAQWGYDDPKYAVYAGNCKVCNATGVTVTATTLTHNWVSKVIAKPQCELPGTLSKTCTKCGATATELIPALGGEHVFEPYVWEATCSNVAQAGYKCVNCPAEKGNREDVGTALGNHAIQLHKDYLAKGYTAPTCGAAGRGYWICTNPKCTESDSVGDFNKTYNFRVIPATDHTYVRKEQAPTCGEDGYEWYQCSVCGTKETDHKGWTSFVTPSGKTETNVYHATGKKALDAANAADNHTIGGIATKMKLVKKDVPATCTTGKHDVYQCVVCGYQAKHNESNTVNKNNHAAAKKVDIMLKPTCTEEGLDKYYCSACKETYYVATDAAHDWKLIKTTTPATCGVDGKGDYECQLCKIVNKDQTIKATGKHTPGEYKVVPATCDYPAMHGNWCTVCGKATASVANVSGSEKLGHKWEITSWITEASCTKAGLANKTCKVCGLVAKDYTNNKHPLYGTENQLIVKAGEHTYGELAVVPANCLYNEGIAKTCKVCGDVQYLENVKKAEADKEYKKYEDANAAEAKAAYAIHNWQWVAYENTTTGALSCLNPNGWAQLKCTTCGESFTKANTAHYPAALWAAFQTWDKHTWTDEKILLDATCTTDGVMSRVCTVCKIAQTTTFKGEHDYAGAVIEINGNGTYAYKRCNRCGAPAQAIELEGVTFIKCGEKHIGNIVEFAGRPATTTASGLTAGTMCDNCGVIVTGGDIIPVANCEHIWETVPAVAATCTTAGSTEGTKCSKCGEWKVKPVVVDALKHKLEDRAGKAAECGVDGYTAYKACVNPGCDYEDGKVVIKAEPHELTVIEAVAPTCTTAGNTKGEKCSKCGYEVAATYLAPLGHTEKVIAAVAPTCTTAGSTEGKVCTVCNAELVAVKEVAALGHTITSTFAFDRDATGKIIGKIRTDVCSVCKVSTETKLGLHD